MNSAWHYNGWKTMEHRLCHNNAPSEAPQEVGPEVPPLSEADKIENAAERLAPWVEKALAREGKIEAFTQSESTEDLNRRVTEVVQDDVSVADRKIEEVAGDLQQANYVVNMEMPGGQDVEVALPSREELIAFLREWKEAGRRERTG